ncbi:MAG TPA: hypothetical protein VGO62_10075 [Myxococcota bacterium]|jgi:hypothetical protein
MPLRLCLASLALAALASACPAPPSSQQNGEGEGEGALSETDAVAIFPQLVGLWTGPATQTPLGDFPVMNMDLRDTDGTTLFSRTDLDAGNSLRFAFAIEDHNGPLLVFRNGGLFQGILRDSRTGLVGKSGNAWHFCSLERGCDYIDATWTLDGDEITLQANVLKAQHLTWTATRAETRDLPSTYPSTLTPIEPSSDFPPLATLALTVSYPALAADADVWVFLSTSSCGQTFACTISRQIRSDAASGGTTTVASFDQLHPGSYDVNVLLDRDRNFITTLRPGSGDGVAIPDQPIDVDGAATGSSSIVFTIP